MSKNRALRIFVTTTFTLSFAILCLTLWAIAAAPPLAYAITQVAAALLGATIWTHTARWEDEP